MRTFVLLFVFAACVAISVQHDSDQDDPNSLENCLAKYKLDLKSVFGISDIKDFDEKSLDNVVKLPADIRGCAIACIYLDTGVITADGKISSKPRIPEGKEAAVDACKAESDLCKLAECLYHATD